MFYALAENEKFLHDKVNLFVALAPIVRFKFAEQFNKGAPNLKKFDEWAINNGISSLFGL